MRRDGRDSRSPIPGGIPSPPGPRDLLEPVFKLRDASSRKGCTETEPKVQKEGRGGRDGGQPSFQRLAFDAGAARHLLYRKLKARQINTDGRRDAGCFIYGLVTGPLLSQSH